MTLLRPKIVLASQRATGKTTPCCAATATGDGLWKLVGLFGDRDPTGALSIRFHPGDGDRHIGELSRDAQGQGRGVARDGAGTKYWCSVWQASHGRLGVWNTADKSLITQSSSVCAGLARNFAYRGWFPEGSNWPGAHCRDAESAERTRIRRGLVLDKDRLGTI